MAPEPKAPSRFLKKVEEDIARREGELREHPERRGTPEDRKCVKDLKARIEKEIQPDFTKQAQSFTVAWELRREEPETQEQRNALYEQLVAPLIDDLAQPVRRGKRSPNASLTARRRIVADNRERALQALSDDDELAGICVLFDEAQTIPRTRAVKKHRHDSFKVACKNCLRCRKALREIVRRDLTNSTN